MLWLGAINIIRALYNGAVLNTSPMSDATKSSVSRSEEILNVAQDFIQTRGYNGFSYRDVAAAIGIKSASIHYHFPTKGDLGRAVAARYCDRFNQALESISTDMTTAREQLTAYVALFRETLVECDRLCMCGMLAGEIETVPQAVKGEVVRFFVAQQQWLSQSIQVGIDREEIAASQVAAPWATMFVASLEGAMLLARGLDDFQHFDTVSTKLLDELFR